MENLSLSDLNKQNLSWYWVDFNCPSEEEIELLSTHFNFHPLAIEDCVLVSNRPKVDYFEDYNFFVFNSLHETKIELREVCMFVGRNFIVSYHNEISKEVNQALERVKNNKNNWVKGPMYAAHQTVDEIVDQFFPAVYEIEDKLDKLDNNEEGKSINKLIDEVFEVRGDLLKLRKLINSMRDLLYRILNSEHISGYKGHKLYFGDIHDHLLKLSDMVESSREMTSDMRDSYLSINSNRMNTNMMVLTVISTIFIPLTFIVGLYGMNFKYMPELQWRYGYFAVLIIMAIIGIIMFLWFRRKGWFKQ